MLSQRCPRHGPDCSYVVMNDGDVKATLMGEEHAGGQPSVSSGRGARE